MLLCNRAPAESGAEALVKQTKSSSLQKKTNPPLSGPSYSQLTLATLQGLQKMHIFLNQVHPRTTHPSFPDPKILCQNKQA